jgi:hypothetical protein
MAYFAVFVAVFLPALGSGIKYRVERDVVFSQSPPPPVYMEISRYAFSFHYISDTGGVSLENCRRFPKYKKYEEFL